MLVFHELGLATRVMEEAAHPDRREVRMSNVPGQAWTAFDLGIVSVQTYGYPYVTMFRPDLLGILSDAVARRLRPARFVWDIRPSDARPRESASSCGSTTAAPPKVTR